MPAVGLSVSVCVSVWVSMCYFLSHRSYLSENKIKKHDVCRFDIYHRMASLGKLYSVILTLTLIQGQTFQVAIFSGSRILNCECFENGES